MKFGEALEVVKEGKKIARTGWNVKGYSESSASVLISTEPKGILSAEGIISSVQAKVSK